MSAPRLTQAWDIMKDEGWSTMPLAIKWLATNFPEIWTKPKDIENDLKRHKKRSNSIYGRGMNLYQYKVERQKRWSWCISEYNSQKASKELRELLEQEIYLRY